MYRTLELDPVQVAEAALEAAHAAQDSFNAIAAFNEDCLRAAEESRERFRAGCGLGPLDGVPVTVKDSYRVAGLPRWHGSAVHDGAGVSVADSAPVLRLNEAGAILVAKTAMPDFGMLASGISSQFGVIRNPWGPEYTPGGSSAGAAVTLAAGVVPVAMGTDIAGSVRLPAAHCGVAAIKPTQGRIAYAPASMARSAGPMARRAADLETMLVCVGRADASDPWCLPGQFEAATWGVDRIRGNARGHAHGHGVRAARRRRDARRRDQGCVNSSCRGERKSTSFGSTSPTTNTQLSILASSWVRWPKRTARPTTTGSASSTS